MFLVIALQFEHLVSFLVLDSFYLYQNFPKIIPYY